MKKSLNSKRKARTGTTLFLSSGIKKNITGSKNNKLFPIVGLGGSAGSLEAFELFFKKMPPDSGMAFVLIAHLDPTRKGLLPELIQRNTKMKVYQAEDGMRVLHDNVYIIPSNKDLALLNGKLHLFATVKTRGIHMPIDSFFRSLAEDAGERAVCVIFSGMGSDGTLGLRAVKERMGLAIAQDPRSTQYNSMPANAINTGIVDYVLRVEDMPKKLISFAGKAFAEMKQALPQVKDEINNVLEKIFIILRTQTGHDFSLYKRNTVHRRIERRLEINGLKDAAHYVRYLQENPEEVTVLFKELLIGVTKFFRDPNAFKVLKTRLIMLLNNKPKGSKIRVWVPACSTGEEAYSIAILLKECFVKIGEKKGLKAQVFASDIDRDSIDKARAGVYPANIAADVSAERLGRFFTLKGDSYKAKKDIREMVVFAEQDVIKDPPFTKLDLLVCRNLLIYLTLELQQKLIPLFHYALNPGGILFQGSAENLGEFTDIFSPLDLKWKIFKRRETLTERPQIPSISLEPSVQGYVRVKEKEGLAVKVDLPQVNQKILLELYAPAAVIINSKGDILYTSGQVGKYLELSQGKPVINIFEMAKEGLQPELSSAIYKAGSQNKKFTYEGLKIKTNGGYQAIDLTVHPIKEQNEALGLSMVIFERSAGSVTHESEAGFSKKKANLFTGQEKELKYAREQFQKMRMERDNISEESKSANEELQSINEELQSTNEELMTSKEEMQSLNEELTTVNSELQEKIIELQESNSDMKNLLDSTEIATIFIDNDLNIKRFTPQINKIINLIPSDVGRPIRDIVMNLKYDDLMHDIKEVLVKLLPREIQIQATSGKWYIIRILPYRTMELEIDGVVITFMDISDIKKLEKELRTTRKYAESVVDTVREPLLVLDTGLRVISTNRSFCSTFKIPEAKVIGQFLYDLGEGAWNIPKLRVALHEVIDKNAELKDFSVDHDFYKIGRKKLLLNARRVKSEDEKNDRMLLALEDITEHR